LHEKNLFNLINNYMNNCEEDTNFYFIFRKISQKLEQICLLIPNKKLKLLSIKLSKKIEDG